MPKKEKVYSLPVAVDNVTGKVVGLLPLAQQSSYFPPTNAPIREAPKNQTETRVNPDPYNLNYQPFAMWGEGNNLPISIAQYLQKLPIAARAVSEVASGIVGAGLYYAKDSDLQNGLDNVKRGYNAEVEMFLRRNRAYSQLNSIANDIAAYYNAFVEFVLNPEGTKIVQFSVKNANWCRISRIDLTSLRSEWLYYSAAFAKGQYPKFDDKTRFAQIPLFDPDDFNYIDKVKNSSVRKFAMHIKPPSAVSDYYAIPPFVGLYNDKGWANVASNVPQIVSAMQRNQVSVKYIIHVSEVYVATRYPNFSSGTLEEKKQILQTLTADIESKIVGSDNVYSSLVIISRESPTGTGQLVGKIQIEAVDDKTKSGAWIPDTAAANREIIYAHGVHPSTIGIQAMGGSDSGSGSDKREIANFQTAKLAGLREEVLSPLNLVIKQFNNWDVTFFADTVLHTTINNQENGIVPTDMRPQINNNL